jgi:hypothetical protein
MKEHRPNLLPGLGDLTPKKLPEPDEDSELPDVSQGYKAYGRATVKPVYSLHLHLGKEGYRSMQYSHLQSDSRFEMSDGHVIILHFAGPFEKLLRVRIAGRNLAHLYDLLHRHCVPWVRRADRDFGDGKEPVVTGIEVTEVAGK